MSHCQSQTSPSRLSPLAKPFTMNRFSNHRQSVSKLSSFSPSFDLSLDPLDHLSLDENPAVSDYNFHGYQSSLPSDHPQYPSQGFQAHSDFSVGFDSMPTNETSLPRHAQNLSAGIGEQGNRVDDRGSFCWIDKNDGGPKPCETLLTQGKAAVAEELKSCYETSSGLQKNCSNMIEKYNQTTSWGRDRLSLPVANSGMTTSKFLTSSSLCSAAKLDVYQSQASYVEPVVSCSDFTPGGAPYERSFSNIDSYSVKATVPHSQEKSYFPSLVFGSAGASRTSLPNNHAFSENFNATVNNKKSSGYTLSSIEELCYMPSAEGRGLDDHKSPFGKGKERKNEKPVSNVPLSPLLMEKAVPQITYPNSSVDFGLKHQALKVGVSVENTSKASDINNADLDVDSPCWKGTQNSCRSPFEASQPVSSNLHENEVEVQNRLNPLAPHFFPCNGKLTVYQNSCIVNGLTSFQKSPTSVVNLSSSNQECIDSVKMGSCPPEPEVSTVIETQYSNDTPGPNTENAMLNNSNICSVLKPYDMVQPCLVEDYFISNEKVASGKTVACSLKGITKDADKVSTGVSRIATECVPSSSSSGVGVPTNICKTLQDVPNSSCRPPRIDVPILINAMSDLSELLVQNFSNDLDSMNELDHDVIQHIINDLYVCIRNRGGQRTLLPESTRPGTSYCLTKSTDLQKLSNMEFQVTRKKAMTVSHGHADQNYEWRKSFSTMFSKEIQDFVGTGSEFGVDGGGHITQVIEKTLKDDHFKEEMHPQTLLYRNLWLEAEAALCSVKYKARLLCMKSEMEGCRFGQK